VSVPGTSADGLIVAVTGTASGLGRTMALHLVDHATGLVLADVDADGLAAIEVELSRRIPVVTLVSDVRDESFPKSFLDLARQGIGTPHVLVNNAGIVPYAPFLTQDRAVFRELFAVDVESVYFLSQEFARQRIAEGGGGLIVNLGTVHSLVGVGGTSAYAAAKGALHALTRALAVELAPHGIRVNTLALGTTMTDRVKSALSPEVLEGRLRQIPLHRGATPEEAAHALQFLIEAEFTTGTEIVLDGGFTVFGDS